VEFEKAGKVRYKSRINALVLLNLAREELRRSHPEAYKIFLLALTAGLRRKEIDNLLWSQIDFSARKLRIETNEHFEAKTLGSEDEIDLETSIAQELLEFYEERFPMNPDFVILSEKKPKRVVSYHRYRCETHIQFLLDWLRANGVESDKPLHTLRKEFGSLVNSLHGIFAASSALRHASISTTREHYIDKKNPITAELSG
jgi:integrase